MDKKNLILKLLSNLSVFSSSSPSHSFLNNSIQKSWVKEELALAQSEVLEPYQGKESNLMWRGGKRGWKRWRETVLDGLLKARCRSKAFIRDGEGLVVQPSV